MPCSTKTLNDGRRVLDATGAPIPDVIEAQTSALTGPTYTQLVRDRRGAPARHLFGGLRTRTVRAEITIQRA